MTVSELSDFPELAVSVVLADTVDCSVKSEEELVARTGQRLGANLKRRE